MRLNWLLNKSYWKKTFKDITEEELNSVIEDLKSSGELNNTNIAKRIIELTIKKNLDLPLSFKDASIFSPEKTPSLGEKIIVIDNDGSIKIGKVDSVKSSSNTVTTIGKVGEYINHDVFSMKYPNGAVSPKFWSGPDYYKIKQESLQKKFITPEIILKQNPEFLGPIIEEKLSASSKVYKSGSDHKWRIRVDSTVNPPPAPPILETANENFEEEEGLPLGRRAPAPRIKSKILTEEPVDPSGESREFREFSFEEWEAVRVEEVSIVLMFAHFFHGFLPYNQITKKVFNPNHKTIVLKDPTGTETRLRKSVEKRMFYNKAGLTRFLKSFDVYAGTRLYIKSMGFGNQCIVYFKKFPKTVKDCRIVKYDPKTKGLYYEIRDLEVQYECEEPIFKSELRFQDLEALWEEARRSGLSISDITYKEFKELYRQNNKHPIHFLDLYYKVFFKRMCSYSAVWSILQRNPSVFQCLGNKYWILIEGPAKFQRIDEEDMEKYIVPPESVIAYDKIFFILQIIALILIFSLIVIQTRIH